MTDPALVRRGRPRQLRRVPLFAGRHRRRALRRRARSGQRGEARAQPRAGRPVIDVLAMLEQKTRGNLTTEERQFLDQVLYELRMRFVAVKGAGASIAMRPARVTFLGTGTSHGVPMIGCRCAVCHVGRSARPAAAAVDLPRRRGRPGTAGRHGHRPAPAGAGPRHLRRVDAMLYTHSHADHVMGLDEMRRFNALRQGADPGVRRRRHGGRAAADVRLRVHAAARPRAAVFPSWR